jgi:acetyltransferase-like isoleucine patch superfamily enzyme
MNIDCKQVKLNIKGNDNEITIIGDKLRNTTIDICGDHCQLVFHEIEHVYNGNILLKGEKNSFIMGEGSSINGCRSFQIGESNHLKIGNGCMLSDGIELWSSDSHNIYDLTTHERLNHERDIILDDHVWVGHGVTLLKGVHIGSGAILGMKAVITKDVPKNSVVVTEYSQRVVKENVYWEP